MTDLRVNTGAIKHAYLHHGEPWSVTPVWRASSRTMTPNEMDAGTRRVVGLLKRFFESRRMEEHRILVEDFEHDLLWDGFPVVMSNKGHVRVANYLANFFAHGEFHPTLASVTPVGNNRHLIDVDAVVIEHPNRVWWIPATLLLPRSIKLGAHFKIGVNGPLETGKIEMVVGRLTNVPAFVPTFVRQYFGLMFGALPHMFEGLWGYLIDWTGDDYYRLRREARFKQRHPNSTNPLLDTVTDMFQDSSEWAMSNARTAADTAWVLSQNVIQNGINLASWWFNTVSHVLEQGVTTASAVAGKVGGTAMGAGEVAYDYGSSAASAARDTAAGAAYAARDTAAGAAYAARDTAAGVAEGAYQGAMGTLAEGAEGVRRTAARAEGTAERKRVEGLGVGAPAGAREQVEVIRGPRVTTTY